MGVTTRARSKSREPSPGPDRRRKPNKAKPAAEKPRKSKRGKKDQADGLSTIREESSSSPETSSQDLKRQSPRLSEGPEFTPPFVPPKEAITAARQEEYPREPPGFKNTTGDVCYRNALVALLLSSNRIISWIQHRYVARLEDAGVQVQTHIEQSQSTKKSTTSNTHHTDIWCELYDLHKLSRDRRTTQHNLDVAMKAFWAFLKNESKREVKTKLFSKWEGKFRGHQDSHELLAWWLELSGEQTRAMTERRSDALLDIEGGEDQVAKLMDLSAYSIKEIATVSQTHRHGCVECKRNVLFRKGTLAEETYWEIPLTQDPESPMPKGKKVKTKELENLISKCMKSKMDGVRCKQCYDKFEKWSQNLRADAKKAGTKQAKAAAEAEIDREVKKWENKTTVEWRRLCSLPEVLILHLLRFNSKDGQIQKDETKVTFEETLDMAPFLEHRMSFGSSTKYRLVAILSHSGTLNAGHVISEVCSGGIWYRVNDDDVWQTTFDDIKKEKLFTPYILLYEKIVEDDGSDDNHADRNVSPEGGDGGGNDDSEETNAEAQQTGIDKDNNSGERDDDSTPLNPCLPTYSPDSDDQAPLQMQLAGDRTPEAGQYLVEWWATINNCKFKLPKLLLEASIPPLQISKDEQGGRYEANQYYLQVNLTMEDSRRRLTQVSGAGLIHMPLPEDWTPPGTPGANVGEKRKRGNDEPVASPGGNKKPKGSGGEVGNGDKNGSPRSGKGRSPSAKSPKTRSSPRGGNADKGGSSRSGKKKSPSAKGPEASPPGSGESWKKKDIDGGDLDYEPTVLEEPGNDKAVSPSDSLASLF